MKDWKGFKNPPKGPSAQRLVAREKAAAKAMQGPSMLPKLSKPVQSHPTASATEHLKVVRAFNRW